MTTAIAAAAMTVTSAGNQPAQVAQPTPQQAARFEALLKEPVSYGAPVNGAATTPAGLQTLVSNFGATGADFRAQFLEFQNTHSTDYAALGVEPTVAAAFTHAEELFSKTARLSYSLFNFQLLTSVEHLSSQSMRTLYQQQG